MNALLDALPTLRGRVAWASLGDFPTPLTDASVLSSTLGGSAGLWLKRDDLSSSIYGGSKLRLLELLLAQAQQDGADQVYSSGAMGSNFAIATALHAPRLGLAPGAIFFPQPLTPEAEASHRVVLERAQPVEIAHWSLLPLATARVKRESPPGKRAVVLPQVGLPPESLFGYLSAGLELAQQVARGEAEAPDCIVLPIGSAATSAGLLAGLSLATKWGIWRARPRIAAVRIAAFPLSRKARVLGLTRRLLERLSDLTGKPEHALAPEDYLELSIVTDQLGRGYPHATSAGRAARERFAAAGFPILDDTYSAKAAAHALELTMQRSGPTLFWCTKSSAPLPPLASREATGSSPS